MKNSLVTLMCYCHNIPAFSYQKMKIGPEMLCPTYDYHIILVHNNHTNSIADLNRNFVFQKVG